MKTELIEDSILTSLNETVQFVRNPGKISKPLALFILDENMRTNLLFGTLQYIIENIPFYKKWYSNSKQPKAWEELFSMLPVIDRRIIYNNHCEFVNPNIVPDGISSTSGTTDLKRRMVIPFCSQERQARSMLVELYALCSGSQNGYDKNGISLRLIPAMRRILSQSSHGSGLQLTAMVDYDFPMYRTRTDYYDYIIQLLSSTYPIQGVDKYITSIHVTPPFLIELLTRQLLDRGVDPSIFKVRQIRCTGGVVSSHFRKRIKELWNATVLSNFSHTEAAVPYFECPKHLNRYHSFIGNYVEVLDEKTNKPVCDYEEGNLVVTTLVPFQKTQPFIRYFMGDRVRKIPTDCECGFIGQSIEWIGRQNHCVSLGEFDAQLDRTYIGTVDVYEAIGAEKDIVSIPFPQFNFQLDLEKRRITLLIEKTIMINDKENEEQAMRVSERLHNNLNQRLEKRGVATIGNCFSVTFLQKGALKEPYFIGT